MVCWLEASTDRYGRQLLRRLRLLVLLVLGLLLRLALLLVMLLVLLLLWLFHRWLGRLRYSVCRKYLTVSV